MGELLRDELLEHCDQCTNGFDADGHFCLACGGSTRRRRGRFDPRSAIDAEPTSSESLHAAQYSMPPETHAARLVPTRSLLRLVELAQLVRSPENSAPLTELLDLIEEVVRG